jgi:hypothetical protein
VQDGVVAIALHQTEPGKQWRAAPVPRAGRSTDLGGAAAGEDPTLIHMDESIIDMADQLPGYSRGSASRLTIRRSCSAYRLPNSASEGSRPVDLCTT